MDRVRYPAVAGSFYEGEAPALRTSVDSLLARARSDDAGARSSLPKALIVPHAGYLYSGPVAARAYSLLEKARGRISRVVLLGPAHRVYFRGLALPGAEVFRTPLGDIPVDWELVHRVKSLPQVGERPEAHRQEHSLEVQLPFLQRVLGGFAFLPLVVGEASPREVLEVLEAVRGGPETLLVISSDLSHYLSSGEAKLVDRATADRILSLDPSVQPELACGATPVNGLLLAARKWPLIPVLIEMKNSGETAGGVVGSEGRLADRVVGYASFAFYETETGGDPGGGELQEVDGELLLALAREEVARVLGVGVPSQNRTSASWLWAPGATFVTIKERGALRGCIGSLEARRPLIDDLRANARGAAFEDPRFPPVGVDELPILRFEVSLLSHPEPMPVKTEEDLLARLRPGIDGLVLARGRHRGTFLPQVWEELPDPRDFVRHLKVKAGFSPVGWPEGAVLSRYTVRKWSEAP
ncbi:MAG: AmmeMemoRadiSam system protein B [Leptospirillia bacterium]